MPPTSHFKLLKGRSTPLAQSGAPAERYLRDNPRTAISRTFARDVRDARERECHSSIAFVVLGEPANPQK